MGELHRSGATDVPVWTLDERLRLRRSHLTHVFASGTKVVYELRLASGRTVKASANHPFLALEGWYPLEDLDVGDRIAVPRGGSWPASVGVDDGPPPGTAPCPASCGPTCARCCPTTASTSPTSASASTSRTSWARSTARP